MNRALRPLLLALSVMLLMTVTVQAGGAIRLSPRQVVNADPVSDGRGSFSYTTADGQLCYTLEVRDLTGNPVGAHIHPGARRAVGPIAVHLITPPSATSFVSDCITAMEGGNLTPAELAAIAADPRSFYVQVHTEQYRSGEIRAQLR